MKSKEKGNRYECVPGVCETPALHHAAQYNKQTGDIPIVIHCRNHRPSLVTMLLDDFIDIALQLNPQQDEVVKRSWQVAITADGRVASVCEEDEATELKDCTVMTVKEFTAVRAAKLAIELVEQQLQDSAT